MVEARLEKTHKKEDGGGGAHCPHTINRINLRNDLNGEDMNNEINK